MHTSILTVKSWNEPKIENFNKQNSLAIAEVEYEVTGHLIGSMKSIYIIHYSKYNLDDLSTAQSTFTGYSIFTGKIANQDFNITFQENGRHNAGLQSILKIIGHNTLSFDEEATYTLDKNQVILSTSF